MPHIVFYPGAKGGKVRVVGEVFGIQGITPLCTDHLVSETVNLYSLRVFPFAGIPVVEPGENFLNSIYVLAVKQGLYRRN